MKDDEFVKLCIKVFTTEGHGVSLGGSQRIRRYSYFPSIPPHISSFVLRSFWGEAGDYWLPITRDVVPGYQYSAPPGLRVSVCFTVGFTHGYPDLPPSGIFLSPIVQ